MNKTDALQNLLNGNASEEDIALLKRLLASGEIFIGGNVSNSVIIQGSENNVQVFQLTPEMLELLGGHKMLGNLERDLSGDEIVLGLQRLEAELPVRAPVLKSQFQEHARRLHPTLKTNPNALSESARKERLEALAHVNSLCMEALDISFNAVATGEALPEYESRCPFRGLESFRVEDREFFFGREELTQKLVRKIKAHPFLAVLGASGSGKSSLVMAGMIPALDLGYAIIHPGPNPLEALESARDKSILVVDQFEELFTLTRDEKTRADFISALLDFAKSGRVIITLRSDFLGEAGAYRSLSGEIQNHLEIIPPMNADELRRAMEGQARWAQLEFEADLGQQILDNVAGEPGAMPLLQHALWELWNRRHGRHLRANEYRAFGGVKQAITSTAEKVYGDCSKPEQEHVRDIFLRLTRLDEDDEGRDTRRRVLLGDLIPSGTDAASISALLDKLASARLIVKMVNDDKIEIEVAHEALIRHWERLRIWLNEDRDNLRLRESLSESAKEWEKSGKHESLLNPRWVKLDDVLLLAQDSRYRLTEIEQAYLKACVSLRERDIKAKETLQRRIIEGLVMGLVIALTLTGFAIYQMQQAKKQAKIARSGELAVEAINLRGENFSLSLLLGIESFKTLDTPQTRGVLLTNVQSNPHLREFLDGKRGPVNSVTFSPDGKILASGYDDHTIILWDVGSGQQLGQPLIGHSNPVSSIAFNDDGSLLASGSCGMPGLNGVCPQGEIIIWDMITHAPFGQPLEGQPKNFPDVYGVYSVDFSPDGKLLAAGMADGTIMVWDVVTRNSLEQLPANYRGRGGIQFSPDGEILAYMSPYGVISLWNINSHEIEQLADNDETDITSISFSPDGRILAAGRNDTITLWDVGKNQTIQTIKSENNSAGLVSFNLDGKILASGGCQASAPVCNRGEIVLWDVSTGAPIDTPFLQHTNDITSIAFSSDGKTLASASKDNEIIVWNLSDIQFISHTLTKENVSGGFFREIAFTPDKKILVARMSDNKLFFFDLKTNHLISEWEIPEDLTEYVHTALSKSGKFLILGAQDYQTISLWDLTVPNPSGQLLTKYDQDLTALALSQDDQLIAVGECSEYINGKSEEKICSQSNIKFFDLSSKIFIGQPLAIKNGAINKMIFSSNGKVLAVLSNEKVITLWNVATQGSLGHAIETKYLWVSAIAFSPDDKILAIGGCEESLHICTQAGISLWDINTQLPSGDSLKGHNDLMSIAFSSDGRTLASGGDGTPLMLWDVTSRQLIGQLLDVTFVANNVVFGPEDNILGTISANIGGHESIVIWDIDPMSWARISCQRAGRNFTRAEWAQYFPNDFYPTNQGDATCPQWPIEPEPTATLTP